MSARRYVVRLKPEGSHPDYLLKRLPTDRRSYDFDLGMHYSLEALDWLSSSEELARRSFTQPEAAKAVREWTSFAQSLNIMHGALPTPSLEAVEPGVTEVLSGQRNRALRLLPLMNDSGPVELLHAIPAWLSSRSCSGGIGAHSRLLYPGPRSSTFETKCAEVKAALTSPKGRVRLATARVSPTDAQSRRERFPFYEEAWTGSFYQGLECRDACATVMTMDEAQRLERAMKPHSEFTDVQVESIRLQKLLGSAEFCLGVHDHPRIEEASPDLSEAVGQQVFWVVWN